MGRCLSPQNSKGTVSFWDSKTGKLLRTWDVPEGSHPLSTAIRFWPNSDLLGVALSGVFPNENALFTLNTKSGSTTASFGKGFNGFLAIALSPDEKTLMSGGASSGSVISWDSERGALRKEVTYHNYQISQVRFSPDGSIVASAGGLRVNFFNTSDGSYRGTLAGSSFAFSPDGWTVASDYRFGIKVSSLSDLSEIKTFSQAGFDPVFSPKGHTISTQRAICQFG